MEKFKQVFSPGKDKDDEMMYGSPSKDPTPAADSSHATPSTTLQTKPEAEEKDHGVFRQIFNPGGDKYSEQSYGTTATGMSDQLQKDASNEPLTGAATTQYNQNVQQEPAYSRTTDGPSTFARKDDQDDVSNATHTARSYALGSGSPSSQRQTASHVDEATRATTDLGSGGNEPYDHGRRLDHSLAGAGTKGAGAGYVNPDELKEFMRHGRDPEADQATYRARDQYIGSSSDADPFSKPGHELYNAERGPAGLQSAGEQAPGHVPGEFPREDGSVPHESSSTGPIQTTTNTMRSGSFSRPEQEDNSGHKGALAAATAAMGVGGAGGAYAVTRDDRQQMPAQSRASEGGLTPFSTSQPRQAGDRADIAAPRSEQTRSYESPTTTSSQYPPSQQEDHTARNAALGAGGVAGAGAGAFASGRDSQDTRGLENTSSSKVNSVSSSGSATNSGSVVSPETQKYHRHHATDAKPTMTSQQHAPVSQPQTASSQPRGEDHTARNAALGTGAAAGAGAGAAYGLSRGNQQTDNGQSVVSSDTQRYAGTHPGDSDSGLRSSPTIGSAAQSQPTARDAGLQGSPATGSTGQYQPIGQYEQPREDHTARNAALGAGGLGAAGAGAGAYYGLNRGNDDRSAQPVISDQTQRYHQSRPGDTDTNLRGNPTTSNREDHSARNAAMGGGATAGAYGASGSGNNPQSVVSDSTQQYYHSHPGDQDSNLSGNPTTSSRDTTNYSRPSAEPERNDHTARNAALGAGAVGAGGAGAYMLSRGDDQPGYSTGHSTVSPETQNYSRSHPTTTNTTTTTTTHTSLPSRSREPAHGYYAQEPMREDHTARNTAAGAGALGGLGAGGYALNEAGRETEPASQAGRYNSNMANRMDPGVPAATYPATAQRDVGTTRYENTQPGPPPQQGYSAPPPEPGFATLPPQQSHPAPPPEPGFATLHDKHDEDPRVAVGEDGRHKLHKKSAEQETRPHADEKEKKPGFLDKLLHRGDHKNEDESHRRSAEQQGYGAPAPNVAGGPAGQSNDGMVTEPHTGLPMNVGKYGDGHGGTDGTEQIEGYHAENQGRAYNA